MYGTIQHCTALYSTPLHLHALHYTTQWFNEYTVLPCAVHNPLSLTNRCPAQSMERNVTLAAFQQCCPPISIGSFDNYPHVPSSYHLPLCQSSSIHKRLGNTLMRVGPEFCVLLIFTKVQEWFKRCFSGFNALIKREGGECQMTDIGQ